MGVNPDLVSAAFVSLMNCFVGALIAVVFFNWTTRLGIPPARSILLSALLAFATPLWFYSVKGFSSEPLFALLLVASFSCVSRTGSGTASFAGGIFFGLAVATRTHGLIYLPALVLYALANLTIGSHGLSDAWRKASSRMSLRNLALLAAGLSIPLVALGYLNFWRFGTVFRTGYELQHPRIINGVLRMQFLRGLSQLLWNGEIGLIWFAPLVILLPFAWHRFHKEHPRESLACGAVLAVHFLFFTSYIFRHGGWSYGPRYSVPVLPFAILPLAGLMADRLAVRAVFTIAVITQIIGNIPSVSRYYYLKNFYSARAEKSWWHGRMLLADIDAIPTLFGNVRRGPVGLGQVVSSDVERKQMEVSAEKTAQSADSYLAGLPNSVNVVAPDFGLLKAWMLGAPLWIPALLAFFLAACGLASAWGIRNWIHARRIVAPDA
jgi:hypothetical protein